MYLIIGFPKTWDCEHVLSSVGAGAALTRLGTYSLGHLIWSWSCIHSTGSLQSGGLQSGPPDLKLEQHSLAGAAFPYLRGSKLMPPKQNVDLLSWGHATAKLLTSGRSSWFVFICLTMSFRWQGFVFRLHLSN